MAQENPNLEEANTRIRDAVAARAAGKADPRTPSTREPGRGPSAAEVVERFGMHPGSTAFLSVLDELRELHRSKAADYGSVGDPLKNIRSGAEFVGIEPWRAAMVRIADKVSRLGTHNRTGALRHEGVEDTLLDLASYSLLALVLYREYGATQIPCPVDPSGARDFGAAGLPGTSDLDP
jgi:hypothetical protein